MIDFHASVGFEGGESPESGNHRIHNINMRASRLLPVSMQNWRTGRNYGKKRWIAVAAVLAGCVPLAILLETFSAEESFSSNFFGKVAHAASCSSTYVDPLEDDSVKIIFSHNFANRVFVAFRSDNTLTVNIDCLSQVLLVISLTVALIAFLQLSVVAIYILKLYFRKPNPGGSSTEVEPDAEENSLSSRYLHDCIPYSYKHLAQAAKDFTQEIGKGSFGVVYRGELVQEGRPPRSVAIKKMIWTVHRNVDKAFEAEIRRIGMLSHKNVLQLLGYSDLTTSDDLPLLMVTPLHCSLAKHLEDSSLLWLNWEARFKIAVGVAKGLAYLHDGAPQKLVHHDIKPGNILFDMDTWQAYIADFGSAKFMEPTHDAVETSNIAGTSGYMDPHFRDHKSRSTKVDVYSFGVVLFVLVAGARRGQEIPALVLKAKESDVIDPDFSRPDASYNRDEVIRTLVIARLCTKYEPSHRPTMSEVVMMLRNDISVWRFAQDLSRAASYGATFAQAAFSKMKSFNTGVPKCNAAC